MTIEKFHWDSEAEWRPLEAILQLRECGAFMYMGWFELDGHRLHHYRHSFTRRYLFVTDELQTYRYMSGFDFVPQPRKNAIRYALTEPS